MPVPMSRVIMNGSQTVSLVVVSIWYATDMYVSFIALP